MLDAVSLWSTHDQVIVGAVVIVVVVAPVVMLWQLDKIVRLLNEIKRSK